MQAAVTGAGPKKALTGTPLKRVSNVACQIKKAAGSRAIMTNY